MDHAGSAGFEFPTGQLSTPEAQQGGRTHHVLRDKHVEIQAIFADPGSVGVPDACANSPADTDGWRVTFRKNN